ncbi:MAG TPA: polysaccharide biosynthesis C-terminal domain-containing protein, partial [Ktedonobacterales bacterium]
RLIFRWFSLFLLLAAFAFSLAGKLLLIWFFPPAYRSVAAITPLIAASIVFFGVYNVVMVGAGVRRKPWMGGVFATIAAVANLALNFVLIPRFGAIGAALSTLIAYVVLAVAGYLANQRIYPIPFEIGRFVVAALSGAAIYLGYYIATAGLPEKTALPIGIGGLIAYGILLFFIGQGGNLIGKIPGGVPQPAFIRRGLSRGVVAGGDLSRSVDPTPPPLSLQPEAPVRLARVRMGGRAELMAAVLVVGLVAGLAFVIHPTLASTATAPPPVPPSNTTEPLGPILSGSSIGGTMAAFSQTYGSPVSAKASSAHYLVQLSGQKVGVDVTLTPGRDNQPHVIAIVLSLVSSDARWQPKNVDQLVSGFLPPDAQKLLDGNDRQDVYEQVYSSASLAGTLPDGAFSDDNLNPVTPGRFNVTCTGDVRGFTSCFVSPGQH